MVGTIMWEIKRTTKWNNDWLAKAKHDAMGCKAEIVIIVSDTTPSGITSFDLLDGVWVCRPNFASALACALRQQMEQVSTARRVAEGKQGKSETLYDYMTGPEFRARFAGIVEPFVQMQKDLDSEKRSTITRWNKRQKQIEGILNSASALNGDLLGIGGHDMTELPDFTAQEDDVIEA